MPNPGKPCSSSNTGGGKHLQQQGNNTTVRNQSAGFLTPASTLLLAPDKASRRKSGDISLATAKIKMTVTLDLLIVLSGGCA
ncbi:hypothetical protein SKAU_G00057470 [Synaphobranchus kaupii]|uniref:Uncharacterized protein n=1 Tax=Synaphobranchus kaupii TaxID=118154 RepID=A0A9Q1JAE7_SYNKA|nr:hypothetical protein SKAU_G00057470 [Synaphobranchus kaupii]